MRYGSRRVVHLPGVWLEAAARGRKAVQEGEMFEMRDRDGERRLLSSHNDEEGERR
jgi:hypothetical protein